MTDKQRIFKQIKINVVFHALILKLSSFSRFVNT